MKLANPPDSPLATKNCSKRTHLAFPPSPKLYISPSFCNITWLPVWSPCNRGMQNQHNSCQAACCLRGHHSETTQKHLACTFKVKPHNLQENQNELRQSSSPVLYACMQILFGGKARPPVCESLVPIYKTTASPPRMPSPEYLPLQKPENSQLRKCCYKLNNDKKNQSYTTLL